MSIEFEENWFYLVEGKGKFVRNGDMDDTQGVRRVGCHKPLQYRKIFK